MRHEEFTYGRQPAVTQLPQQASTLASTAPMFGLLVKKSKSTYIGLTGQPKPCNNSKTSKKPFLFAGPHF